MKVVCISDTHGFHQKLNLPQGDLLIHAGDCTARGKRWQVDDFLNWFSSLPFQYKVFIAGNHDFYFEDVDSAELELMLPDNVIYLNDSGVEIKGIQIWGSPIQPWFHDWAFNRRLGPDIQKHWDLIPQNVDLLITHGPAFTRLDATIYGKSVGCPQLLQKIEEIKPKYHICGHIHEAYGQVDFPDTRFINASILDVNYRPVNEPISFSLEP